MRIAVIGGGISGLAAAHRLVELAPKAEVRLFEASNRLGGVLETLRDDGYLIERSADSFITRLPYAVELCRQVGIADELVPTDELNRRALVVSGGRLEPVPAGFVIMSPGRIWPLLTTPILSWPGKLRLLAERFVPSRQEKAEANWDESVATFATRRLGRETYERLVQPLVAGIYTADGAQLSMAATMPEFLEQELELGSLSRRPLATEASGARYGMFLAPRDGMTRLVAAVAARLPADCIRLETAVEELLLFDGVWTLRCRDRTARLEFDAVILALPAYAAAKLLHACSAELSRELAAIQSAGCVVVSLIYQNSQLRKPLNGFGFVVPAVENRPVIAASFASEKFAGRTPSGESLIRVFLGGALRPTMLERSDAELRNIAHSQLVELLGLAGEPRRCDVARWPRAMPQYSVGHLERVARISELVARLPGLALAGNSYRGVGIPQCIRSGWVAADATVEFLGAAK
jgi:oxygen-dependent protoporphyrinogen oxidase